MSAGPLSSRVADLCQEVGNRLGDPARTQVLDVRRRLGEPLRVAIAGRLKSGKSTLVNALIGRRVAPTEVGECTRIVTQFRYGTSDRVDIVRRNGTRGSLPLDEAGMIPQRLGIPRHEIAYVDVTLTSDHLRDLTVVDTPGLSSANTSVSDQARRFLFSDQAPGGPTEAPIGSSAAAASDGVTPAGTAVGVSVVAPAVPTAPPAPLLRLIERKSTFERTASVCSWVSRLGVSASTGTALPSVTSLW